MKANPYCTFSVPVRSVYSSVVCQEHATCKKENSAYFIIPLKPSSWDRPTQFPSFLTGIL